MINLLERSLKKMPKYDKNLPVFRGISLSGDNLEKFLFKHQQGKIVEYKDFVSAGNDKYTYFDKTSKNIKITFYQKNAYNITDLSDGVQLLKVEGGIEVLFNKGTKFKVLGNEKTNNTYHIILEEL